MTEVPLLRPSWAAPAGVGAAMSLRGAEGDCGGRSSGPYASLNLGVAVGDDAAVVAANRARFSAAIGAHPVWLRQVHGTRVRQLGAAGEAVDSVDDGPADAAWTRERGVACTVQVADCLPVLYAMRDGSAVAAAHAGWRGLAGGVLEAALAVLCRGSGGVAADVVVWLGPCIGKSRFEVGVDVRAAFGADADGESDACFVPRPRADGSVRWLADLQGLAHRRLAAAGVRSISVDASCTYEQQSRFFSFRRNAVTGRMAAAVWLR